MKPRKQRTSTLLLLALSSLATASQLPFQPAETAQPLARRQQQGCLTNFYSCASQGAAFANICCANGQVCSLDASNNPACCPAKAILTYPELKSAVCTGTAPSSFAPPSSTSVSYVPNAYFSFPYAPTSFVDSGACSSAASACGANYDSCTSHLEGVNGGGGAAVTVVVPGTTVVGGGQAGVTLATASATSICSSLRSAACGGLQSDLCAGAGVTTGGFVIGTGTGNGAAARQTGCAVGMMVAAGVGLGIVNGL
ncbi:hypothetical protein CONLIGDRAFT_638868 [Coniochaeta ligniaria NRRL 30616]|uniref:Gpi-anchored protein n=1 Tax=Coniochaeta ligniaria NRRL 30616 TaxID=1408157 RepID=A0A1J7K2X3_9PEZI|nr:hypothetical protein CONLIGDRAFT_638868 [Coniochaeta ligniaria NRRL 30616]